MDDNGITYWRERALKAERAMDEFTDSVERHELCGDHCISDDILETLRSHHRWNCDVLNGYGRWCSCG